MALKARIEQAVQLSLDEGLIIAQADPDDEMHCGMLPTLSTKIELRLWKLVQSSLRNSQSLCRLKPIYGRNIDRVKATTKTPMLDEPQPTTEKSATSPLTDDEDYWMLLESDPVSLNDMLESNDMSELGESMLDEIPLEAKQEFFEEASICSDDMLPDGKYQDEDLFADNTLASQTDSLDSQLFSEEVTGDDHDHIFDDF